jgi:hypothetical protein
VSGRLRTVVGCSRLRPLRQQRHVSPDRRQAGPGRPGGQDCGTAMRGAPTCPPRARIRTAREESRTLPKPAGGCGLLPRRYARLSALVIPPRPTKSSGWDPFTASGRWRIGGPQARVYEAGAQFRKCGSCGTLTPLGKRSCPGLTSSRTGFLQIGAGSDRTLPGFALTIRRDSQKPRRGTSRASPPDLVRATNPDCGCPRA